MKETIIIIISAIIVLFVLNASAEDLKSPYRRTAMLPKEAEIDKKDKVWIDKINAEFDEMSKSDKMLPPIAPGILAQSDNVKITVNFKKAPLAQVLHFYGDIANAEVRAEDGLEEEISYYTHRKMSLREILIMINIILKHYDIELERINEVDTTDISRNTVVQPQKRDENTSIQVVAKRIDRKTI